MDKYRSKLEDKIRSVLYLTDEHIGQDKQKEKILAIPVPIYSDLLREKVRELNSCLDTGWTRQSVNRFRCFKKIICLDWKSMKASWENLENETLTARPIEDAIHVHEERTEQTGLQCPDLSRPCPLSPKL